MTTLLHHLAHRSVQSHECYEGMTLLPKMVAHWPYGPGADCMFNDYTMAEGTITSLAFAAISSSCKNISQPRPCTVWGTPASRMMSTMMLAGTNTMNCNSSSSSNGGGSGGGSDGNFAPSRASRRLAVQMDLLCRRSLRQLLCVLLWFLQQLPTQAQSLQLGSATCKLPSVVAVHSGSFCKSQMGACSYAYLCSSPGQGVPVMPGTQPLCQAGIWFLTPHLSICCTTSKPQHGQSLVGACGALRGVIHK